MQRNDTTAGKKTPLIDTDEVRLAMRLLLPPGQVTELRALDAVTAADRWPHTAAGYFDDIEKLIDALGTIKSAKGIYFTPNPVDHSLLARAANRIRKAPKGESTADTNIVARHWLLIDCDAQRVSGISASDAEHDAAIECCQKIKQYLHTLGWPDPITADSGNGGHLLYRVDQPADDAGLVQRCLAALAARFDDEQVKIDQTVFNPARIWKLYGTLACKGDNTPARPHRMSRILSVPDPIMLVGGTLLESLATKTPAAPLHDPHRAINGQPFDIDSFIASNGFEVDGPDSWQGGRRWVFRRSPLCEHHEGAAFLIQHASGAITAKCHHNSCLWGWRELRAKYAPLQHTTNGHADRFHKSPANGANPYTSTARDIESYKPFPIDVLPSAIGDFVRAASGAIGCDPSFIALPLLGCLARAIGNKRVIRLKRTWTEPAIIWAAIVGKSGTHKTPALQAATAFLSREQQKAITAFEESVAKHDQDVALYERDYQAWKRSKSTEPPPWKPEVPVCNRFITTDCTIEALASLLHSQFDGVLVPRDELAGWLGGIAEYKGGKGSDLGHWLASWSAAPLTVDRKTGAVKMIHVPRASVSIVGGIQPGVLRKSIGLEHMQDGLCARLLLAMPDPKPVRWTDAIVNADVEAAMTAIFDKLIGMPSGADGDGNPEPFAMALSDAAKPVWVEYFNRHRAELSDLDDDLAAAWSKLEAYTTRFALIFQLCAWAAGEQYASEQLIDEAAMQSAITLSDWFGGEARRVYGLFGECEADRETRELIEWIRRKGGVVTVPQVQRGHRRFTNSADVEAALADLAKAGFGAWAIAPTATNKRREFKLSNPSTYINSHESREIGESVYVDSVDTPHTHNGNGHSRDIINQLFCESVEGDE